jgi:hypothetical protein
MNETTSEVQVPKQYELKKIEKSKTKHAKY